MPLQAYLEKHHYGQTLVRLDRQAGGGKYMQATIYMGAFNYLDIALIYLTTQAFHFLFFQ